MMNKIKHITLILMGCVIIASCEEASYPAKFTVKVVDEEGEPVAQCPVKTSTFIKWQQGQGFGKDIWKGPDSKTDENGMAVFEYEKSKRGEFGIQVYPTPEGYYRSFYPNYQFKNHTKGQWNPENPTIEYTLKSKKNPIAMYVRRVGAEKNFSIPKLNQEVGFDLVKSDWVAPHGGGIVSDLIFKLERRFVSVYDFDCVFTVSFSNEKDGLISAKKAVGIGSEFRLAYEAPNDGYQSELVKKAFAHPPSKAITTGIDEEQNYYIRVRTELDKDGSILKAQYGKIYGDFKFSRFDKNKEIQFTYYLNPNENDRNIEFDLSQNLLKNLQPSERVREP